MNNPNHALVELKYAEISIIVDIKSDSMGLLSSSTVAVLVARLLLTDLNER